MAQPAENPSKKKKPKGQPSPYSLFFAAFLAYVFGAPSGIVLFLIGLGIIFWRVQAAAKNMAKLPPLPPKETGPPDLASAQGSLNAEDRNDRDVSSAREDSIWNKTGASTKPSLEDTAWGRNHEDTDSFSQSDRDRYPSDDGLARPEQSRDIFQSDLPQTPPPVPHPFTAPEPVAQTSRVISSTTQPLPPPKRQAGLGVNLATQAGLRQAIVAMTILGPCRALNAYQDQPLATGLPDRSSEPSKYSSTLPPEPRPDSRQPPPAT